jgi:hypothetical protein
VIMPVDGRRVPPAARRTKDRSVVPLIAVDGRHRRHAWSIRAGVGDDVRSLFSRQERDVAAPAQAMAGPPSSVGLFGIFSSGCCAGHARVTRPGAVTASIRIGHQDSRRWRGRGRRWLRLGFLPPGAAPCGPSGRVRLINPTAGRAWSRRSARVAARHRHSRAAQRR